MAKSETIQYIVKTVADESSAKKSAKDIESALNEISESLAEDLSKAFQTFSKHLGNNVKFPQSRNFAEAVLGGKPEEIEKTANKVVSYVNGLYKAIPNEDNRKMLRGFSASQLNDVAKLSNELEKLKGKAAEAESEISTLRVKESGTSNETKKAEISKEISELEKKSTQAKIKEAHAERRLRDVINAYAKTTYTDDSEQSNIFKEAAKQSAKKAQNSYEKISSANKNFAWGLDRPSLKNLPDEYKSTKKYLVGAEEARFKIRELLDRYNSDNTKKGVIPTEEDMRDLYGYYGRLANIVDNDTSFSSYDGETAKNALTQKMEEDYYRLDNNFAMAHGDSELLNFQSSVEEASDFIEKLRKIENQAKKVKEQIDDLTGEESKLKGELNSTPSSSGESNDNTQSKEDSNGQFTSEPPLTNEEGAFSRISETAQIAIESKKAFTEANEQLRAATEQSVAELQKEADLFGEIATKAESAATSKDMLARVALLEQKTQENTGSSGDKKSSDSSSKNGSSNKKSQKPTKSEIRKQTNENLKDTIAEYKKVSKRVAKGNNLAGDLELLNKLQNKIARIQSNKQGILSNSQLQKSKNQLEKINQEISEIQKKAQIQSLSKIDKDIGKVQSFANRHKVSAENNTPEQINEMKNLENLLKEFKSLRGEGNIENLPNSTIQRLKEISVQASEAAQKYRDLDAAAREVSREKLNNRISDYLSKNTAMSEKFRLELRELQHILSQKGLTNEMLSSVAADFQRIQAEIKEAGQEGKRFWDIIKQKAYYNLAQQLSMYFSFYDIIRMFKQGIDKVKDLDTALTEMRKVSDESDRSLQNFQKTSFTTGKQIGATAQQVQNSAADFMRLGYSLKEASSLSKDANIYANVGDMNIDEATEHMISSIKAWGSEFDSETEASSVIVDRYNEIGNNFAITSADIGEAMERSAAALKAGGNNLNESLGLITAGNLIQQDADTTANALKVLSLRIRGKMLPPYKVIYMHYANVA